MADSDSDSHAMRRPACESPSLQVNMTAFQYITFRQKVLLVYRQINYQ